MQITSFSDIVFIISVLVFFIALGLILPTFLKKNEHWF